MKKLIINTAFLSILTITFFSCSKSEDSPKVNLCETQNFGVVTFNFSDITLKHSAIYTEENNPSNSKEKIFNIGVTSDTMHIKPSVYNFSISSLDNSNLSIESESRNNVLVKQCETRSLSVSF